MDNTKIALIITICLLILSLTHIYKTHELLDEKDKLIEQFSERVIELEREKEELQLYQAYKELGEFKLTAYCPCEICCGKWADGITKTGTQATSNRTIAVDPNVIPLGSEVIINGRTYIAEDIGGAINGLHIDVFFNNHDEAIEFGVQTAEVVVKGEKND